MKKLTPTEARAQGFAIDTTTYPWTAYKGDRFAPSVRAFVFTDTEAALLEALEGIFPYAESRVEDTEECAAECDVKVACGKMDKAVAIESRELYERANARLTAAYDAMVEARLGQ